MRNSQILFLFFLILVFVARWHLLAFPLERDEGEFALMGKLILQGHPPYTLAYNMKLPGTYFMFALMMAIFGQTTVGIHLGLTLMICLSMSFVYWISLKYLTPLSSAMASGTFGLMGTSWNLLAQAAHATHFVVFFALLATVFALIGNEKPKSPWYFGLSGLSFALAFLCKQSGLFFVFIGLTILYVNKHAIKGYIYFISGYVGCLIALLLYFYFWGDFSNFWFWTVTYLSNYGTQVSVQDAPLLFFKGIKSITANFSLAGYTLCWLLLLPALIALLLPPAQKQTKVFLLVFFVCSFLSVVPGFYFREHYFITLLPALALLVGFLCDKFKWSFLGLFLLLGLSVYPNFNYLYNQDPVVSCKNIYTSNPFVESIAIADYIQKSTGPNDKIAILGSEPQITFYADRTPATGFIYTYNLMEIHPHAHQMQLQMADEIAKNKPNIILFVKVYASWLSRQESDQFIYKWADDFTSKNYTLDAIMEIDPTVINPIITSNHFPNYKITSKDVIYIFKLNK